MQSNPVPIIERWTEPPAMDTGAPLPQLHFSRDLYCTYYLADSRDSAGHEQIAILRFSSVLHISMGHPNDEALHGHPLYKSGLAHYDFFRVLHSPLIAEIEARNAVHRLHRSGMYSEFRHFIATFHDETLEVISRDATFLGTSKSTPWEAIHSFIGTKR